MRWAGILWVFIMPVLAVAQQPEFSEIQQQWLDESRTLGKVGYYVTNGSFVYGAKLLGTIRGESLIYHESAVYKHDETRFLTLGRIETADKQVYMATGWMKVQENWLKTIDILLPAEQVTKSDTELETELNNARKRWVELANQHNPLAHVSATYRENATYFGAGELSEGHEEIADRYFYMENPDYQVDLVATKLVQIESDIVFETGRYYTGSDRRGSGGIYVIIWERTESGNWLIALDFNF